MLKLYTNTSFLTETHRKKVFPLLFDIHYLKNEALINYFRLVNVISECDIIVFPIDYISFIKHKNDCLELQKLAKTYKKPIWIYTAGDYGFTNYINNSYTFRLGGFDSKLNDTTFIMPSFINDPYVSHLQKGFSILKKETQPVIGFVGHAKSGLIKFIKELIGYVKYQLKRKTGKLLADNQSFYPSSIKRFRYLKKLKLSKVLKTNFILRENYRAGQKNQDVKEKTTKEFYENIYNNTYTFCSRGVGNFSVRFYETLAVGRIPILLNTDCRLPLEDIINWNDHVIILDKKRSLEFQILEFHNSKTDIQLEAIQETNRGLWKTHLERCNYFIKIHDVFIKQIKK